MFDTYGTECFKIHCILPVLYYWNPNSWNFLSLERCKRWNPNLKKRGKSLRYFRRKGMHAVQTCANLVDLETCSERSKGKGVFTCKESASTQPRTSPTSFAV